MSRADSASVPAGRQPQPCESSWASRSGRRVATALALPLVLAPALGAAQEWRVEPTANIELRYEDNVTLSSSDDGAQDSFGSSLRAAVRARRATETSDLTLRTGVSWNEFADVSGLDNLTGLLDASYSKTAPRGRWGIETSLSTQSTLTSELETSGLSDINKQQYQLNVRPYWEYYPSERIWLGISPSFQRTVYEDAGGTDLFDYHDGDLSLSGGYRLSERAELAAVLGYGFYNAHGVDNESETLSALVGAEYLLAENARLELLIGLRRTERRFEDPSGQSLTEESSGPTYRLSLSRDLARGGGFSLEASREVTPSGAGEVVDLTRVQLGLSYPFHERLSLRLGVQGSLSRAPSGDSDDEDVGFASGDLGLSYLLAEGWRVGLGFRHRWQSRDEGSDAGSSNTISLTLAWTGR